MIAGSGPPRKLAAKSQGEALGTFMPTGETRTHVAHKGRIFLHTWGTKPGPPVCLDVSPGLTGSPPRGRSKVAVVGGGGRTRGRSRRSRSREPGPGRAIARSRSGRSGEARGRGNRGDRGAHHWQKGDVGSALEIKNHKNQ